MVHRTIYTAMLCLLASACSTGPDSGTGSDSDMDPDSGTGPGSGELSVLSYNVAGLPEGISGSHPETYTPLISPLLNNHDLVLVQEDFAYHEPLSAEAEHPHQSEPMAKPPPGKFMNDGLNRFSVLPFSGHVRQMWESCYGEIDNGSDCLAAKGFAMAETELASGVVIHVYNLHMDAGGSQEDQDARSDQVDQLLTFIQDHSAGQALIVAGDTNLKARDTVDDSELLERLLEQAELTDACRSVSCGEERIDRVMLRGSDRISLKATRWEIDRRFVDDQGNDLSDHEALAVQLQWRVEP